MKPTKEQVFEFARQEALRQGVSPEFVANIVRQESAGKSDARGPVTRSGETAFGPMQLMPATAKGLGVDRMDWQDNIRGGVKYLGQMLQKFDDPRLAAAAYNAGPGNVQKYGGVPPFKETQDYVQKVVGTNMATRKNFIEVPDEEATPQAPAQNRSSFIEVDDEIAPSAPVRQAPVTTAPSAPRNTIARQIGLTGRYALEGAGQIADIIGSPLNKLINRATGSNLVSPSAGMANLATSLGLPQPEGEFEKGIAGVTRAVAGVPIMAGTGNLMNQFGGQLTQAVGRGFAAQPTAQVAAAATGAGAAEFANRQLDVQNPLALLGINLAAGFPAGAVASRATNIPSGSRYANPQTGQFVEDAAKRNVNLDVLDVGGAGSGVLNKARQFGYQTANANQQKSAQVRNLIEKVTDQVRPTSVVKEGSEKLVIATDLRNQYKLAKNAVSPIFERAEKLAGNTQIPLSNTNNAVINVLDNFPATSDTTVISKTVDRINNFLQSGGGTYKELRDVQKTVGAELDRVSKGVPGGSYSEPQKSALSQLYGGLADDVNAWAAPRTLNGKPVYTPAGAEHARAIEQFKNTVLPFRQDQSIYKIVSSKTPSNEIDKIAQGFSLTGNPATAELAVNLMSPNGRQAAQYSILNQARNASINEDAAALLSSPAFTRTLNLGRPDFPSAQRIVMGQTPEVMNEVGLLRNIVDATRGSITPKVGAQTGIQNLPFTTMGVGATAGSQVGNMFGLDPVVGGLLGSVVTPGLANLLGGAMSTKAGTRYLLGEQFQGTGAFAPAMGQAINSATNEVEDPSSAPFGLLNYDFNK